MKNTRFMVSATFALFVLLTSALAQTRAIRVTVPFDFTVGKQTLAAGDYSVTINRQALLKVVRIDGAGFASALTNYKGGGPNQNLTPKLVFNRYGNRSFLAEAWIGDMGHELSESAAELEYTRTMKQDQTTVLASRMNTK